MRGREHLDLAKARQDMLSDALIEDDQKTGDIGLYLVAFVVAVVLCTFVALQFGMSFGPMLIILSMGVGALAVGLLATRLLKKRAAHYRAIRQQRQAIADAERARQIKDMKRERFEAGK